MIEFWTVTLDIKADRCLAIEGKKSGCVVCLYAQEDSDEISHRELQIKIMSPGVKGKELEWVLYFLHHWGSVYE